MIASIKKFIGWYRKKFGEKPFIVIITSIVSISGAIGTVYSGTVAIKSTSEYIEKSFFKNDAEYEKIDRINTGLSIDYIELVLENKPARVQKLPKNIGDFTENIYVKPSYFLQIITNKERRVVFYSVTARDENFKPNLPYGFQAFGESNSVKRLNESFFSDFPNPESFYANFSVKFIFYEDEYYFGNPGHYKTYYLANSPAGYQGEDNDLSLVFDLHDKYKDDERVPFGFRILNFDTEVLTEDEYKIPSILPKELAMHRLFLPNEVIALRNKIKPNTFAVAEKWLDEDEPKLIEYLYEAEDRNGIGPNYLDSRELE